MILTTKEMAYLIPSFTDRSPLSIFENINATPDGSENGSLIKKGIIQGNGYSKEALELLTLLAKPDRCTRLIVQSDLGLIEKYSYKSSGNYVLVQNSKGEMLIDKMGNFGDVITGLGDFFGLSKIKTTDISILLTVNELLVLLAVMDIYRKNVLMSYAGKPVSLDAVPVQEIVNELSGNYENGLVKLFVKNYNSKVPPASEVEPLLQKLVQKKCVAFDGGYKLTLEFAILSKKFLTTQSIVLVETFGLEGEKELSAAGSVFVAAGLHDIISFSFTGVEVEFSTVSATQLLLTVEDFLNCPDFIREEAGAAITPPPVKAAPSPPPAQAQTPPPATGAWQCSCGKNNTTNFCSACGKKRP